GKSRRAFAAKCGMAARGTRAASSYVLAPRVDRSDAAARRKGYAHWGNDGPGRLAPKAGAASKHRLGRFVSFATSHGWLTRYLGLHRGQSGMQRRYHLRALSDGCGDALD